MSSVRRVTMTALVMVLLVGAAGCGGLALDEEPRVIDSGRVPEALLSPTPSVTAEPGPASQGVDADLFFFLTTDSDEFLVPCSVPTAAGGSVEARTRAVLERLINLDPAISDECSQGLTNAVPSNLVVLGTQLRVRHQETSSNWISAGTHCGQWSPPSNAGPSPSWCSPPPPCRG